VTAKVSATAHSDGAREMVGTGRMIHSDRLVAPGAAASGCAYEALV
jgi:hypothetical protein